MHVRTKWCPRATANARTLTPYALSETTKNVLNIYEMIMDQNLI
jgi:hypothetical protein